MGFGLNDAFLALEDVKDDDFSLQQRAKTKEIRQSLSLKEELEDNTDVSTVKGDSFAFSYNIDSSGCASDEDCPLETDVYLEDIADYLHISIEEVNKLSIQELDDLYRDDDFVQYVEDKLHDSGYIGAKLIKPDKNGEDTSIDESTNIQNEDVSKLHPQFDSRNSFYGKARVDEKPDGSKVLYSYNTPVCRIKDGKVTLLHQGYLGWSSSQTTLRHVKEFLKQNGFEAGSYKELAKAYPEEEADITECIKEDKETDKLKEPVTSSKETETTDTTKTPEAPADYTATDVASMINADIVGELKTIDIYNQHINTVREMIESGAIDADKGQKVIDTWTDIDNEENIHAGQLQTVLKLFSPNAESIKTGEKEAADKIAGTDSTEKKADASTESASVPVDEALKANDEKAAFDWLNKILDASYNEKESSYDWDKVNAEVEKGPYNKEMIKWFINELSELGDDGYSYDDFVALCGHYKQPKKEEIEDKEVCPICKHKPCICNKKDKPLQEDWKTGLLVSIDAPISQVQKAMDEKKLSIANGAIKTLTDVVGKDSLKFDLFNKNINCDYAAIQDNKVVFHFNVYDEDIVNFVSDSAISDSIKNKKLSPDIEKYASTIVDTLSKMGIVVSNVTVKTVNPSGNYYEVLDESKKPTPVSSTLKEDASFNIRDDKDIDKAKEFIADSNKENNEQVIDVDADSIADLKKSYLGKLILQCPTCHTERFLDVDKLSKSENTTEDGKTLYNVEDACPHCGAKDGFVVVGQVGKFQPDDNKEDDTDKTETKDKVEKPSDEKNKEEVKPEDKKEPTTENKTDEAETAKNESYTDIDDAAFNKLINNYLTEVYDNVGSYTTTNGSVDNNKLILEGIIKFKSGKEQPTEFVFEKTKDTNALIYEGINTTFAKDKAFKLTGKITNNELVCEELNYKYNQDTNLVEGIVK
jgi:hypothetical protein